MFDIGDSAQFWIGLYFFFSVLFLFLYGFKRSKFVLSLFIIAFGITIISFLSHQIKIDKVRKAVSGKYIIDFERTVITADSIKFNFSGCILKINRFGLIRLVEGDIIRGATSGKIQISNKWGVYYPTLIFRDKADVKMRIEEAHLLIGKSILIEQSLIQGDFLYFLKETY